MPVLKIEKFSGEIPRTSDTQLPDNAATVAENVRLYSGELRTWGGPTIEDTPIMTSVASIYKFKNPDTTEVVWLTWDTDVDVQRGSLADTSDYRLYYTGDGTPKKTNWELGADGSASGPYPATYLEMGVPAPSAAPTVAASAGASLAADTRFYIYTNVSTFGSITEESAPSPPSAAITITASQQVDLSAFSAAPAGDYNITHRNIYRTLPGEESDGAFVFVKTITIGTSSTSDNLLSTELGEPLATDGWDTPPAGLKGLVSMANGMMAGFVGNTVYFCEPFFHHAWPAEYAQSVPDQIVGLGTYGNTLIVMTIGSPHSMIGVSPSSISVDRIAIPEPCITKRSIATDQYGVVYASPNGVVAIGPGTRGVISNALFRRDEWQAYIPSTMISTIYDGKYITTFESAIEGNKTMILSRDDEPALAFLTFRSRAFYTDLEEGDLFYLDPGDDTIYHFDDDPVNPYTYEWFSKRFVFDKAITWSCMRLDISELEIDQAANYDALIAEIIAANALIVGSTFGDYNAHEYNEYTYNGSILQEIPTPGAVTSAVVQLFGEKEVLESSLTIETYDAVRINPFRTRELKIKLSGNLRVRSITLATSFNELRGM